MNYRQNSQIQHPSFKVHVTRGQLTESVHLVDVIVVNHNGEDIFSAGETHKTKVFPRSAIKMLQAVSLVECGAIEKWHLDSRHIALACASHGGEPIHTQLVSEWLKKIKCDQHHLVCAPHIPYNEDSYVRLIQNHQQPSSLHNNCSGKHAGILCALRTQNMDVLGYENYEHPYQFRLREIISELSGEDIHQSPWGIDGCGIPSYSMSLRSIAIGLSQFLPQGQRIDADLKKSCDLIMTSIKAHPELIGGSKDFCTNLLEISQGKAFVKSGAEGVYAGLLSDLGLAFAIKVQDGNSRAARAVVVEILKRFEILNERLLDGLHNQYNIVKNWADRPVGKIFVPTEN